MRKRNKTFKDAGSPVVGARSPFDLRLVPRSTGAPAGDLIKWHFSRLSTKKLGSLNSPASRLYSDLPTDQHSKQTDGQREQRNTDTQKEKKTNVLKKKGE